MLCVLETSNITAILGYIIKFVNKWNVKVSFVLVLKMPKLREFFVICIFDEPLENLLSFMGLKKNFNKINLLVHPISHSFLNYLSSHRLHYISES